MRLQSLGKASQEVLDCRSMGHAWVHVDDTDFVTRRGQIVRFKRIEDCYRCTTTRWREIDLDEMKITKRGTRYADGYLLQKGSGRPTRFDALRVAYRRNK